MLVSAEEIYKRQGMSIYEEVLNKRQEEKNKTIKAKMNLIISKIEFGEKQKKEIDDKIINLNNLLERLKAGENIEMQECTLRNCFYTTENGLNISYFNA